MNNPSKPTPVTHLPQSKRTLTPPVAVVIPAFNEGQHIGNVLEVLKEVSALAEIIVVDDGSTDETVNAVTNAASCDTRVRILKHPSNQGKGQAVLTGWSAARAPYLLLLDADLTGLTPAHIEALIQPVVEDELDMTVGLFRGGRWTTDLSHRAVPWLSGQRCLRKGLLGEISREAALGYGIETAITVAARQKGWRCREVILRGVAPPPVEIHRVLWPGVGARLNMYGDIGRAVKLTRGWSVVAPRLRAEARIFSIFLLLLLFTSLVFQRSRAASQLRLEDIPVLDLTTVQRLLVVSPHPDDETLGAGGLMQAVLARGGEVRVVLLTNGDGQFFAPLAFNRSIRPGVKDFLAHGERRQVEAVQALAELGLSERDVFFLGYPDRRLLTLWNGDWEGDCPVQSIFTRTAYNPYQNSYNPLARYCGNDILSDLKAIIADFLPDHIAVPHPNDDHADHRAAANFARLALQMVQEETDEYRASVIAYLIHYSFFPQPRGQHPARPLLPPSQLALHHNAWFRLNLEGEEIQTKLAALKRYSTQMRLLGKFLPSFARPNELFMAISPIEVLPLEYGVLPLRESGVKETPEILEPAYLNTRQMVVAGADLVAWKFTRLGDILLVTADTRGRMIPGLKYRIMIKTPDGSTSIYNHEFEDRFINTRSFSAKIDLAGLGNPSVLAVAADIQQGMTLDRTGWYFIELKDWLP